MHLATLLLATMILVAAAARATPTVEGVDFAREVAPILSANCIECHGAEKQKGGLRLDTRDGLLASVAPGDAAASGLHERLVATDLDERMPLDRPPLAASEIEAVARWIAAGARVPDDWGGTQGASTHWAYRPLARDERLAGLANPIDAAVDAALEARGLRPAPRADERTLVRRLSLDLRGLPPTPEEVEEHLADRRADKWERLVSKWLDSVAHAERMAQWWLDLARYADTNGYEKDDRRDNWRWRDVVIEGFARNQPFDEFTIEQLAGDLLPEPTLEQRLASGFHRNTLVNLEGGVDPEEFRAAAIVDRVGTTATVWLGSTIACAQCHNHKHDPFSQREYYQLYAFFDRTVETGASLEPRIAAPTREQSRLLAAAEERLAAVRAELDAAAPALEAKYAAWERARHLELQFSSEGPPEIGAWTVFGPVADDGRRSLARELGLVEGAPRALELEGAALPEGRHALPLGGASAVYVLEARSWRKGKGLLRLSADDRVRAWIDGRLVLEDAQWDALDAPRHAIPFEQSNGAHSIVVEVWNDGGAGGFLGELELEGPAGLPQSIARVLLESDRSPEQRALLRTWHRAHAAPAAAALDARVAQAEGALAEARARIPPALVMQDAPEPRTTRIHAKGDHRSPGDAVEPDVPQVLPPLPGGAGRTRLDLARWLVSGDNPLVARVVVNRVWALAFGEGLVATLDDFGTRGDLPTHPALLDELAARFVAGGWNLRELWTLIATSEAWRRESRVEPRALELDPRNAWLARASRPRLAVESLRDAQLAMAGLLSEKVGGPGVMPPQPEGVWAPVYSDDRWTTAEDEDRFRRGLYTFWKRSSPYATFMAFDAPSREASCTRRDRTNTPLQALALLNDPAFVECAAGLAARVLREAGDDRARAERMWLVVVSRKPDNVELESTLRLLALERGRALADPAGAARLLEANRHALRGAEEALPAELAAWLVVANMLLNLDEAVVRG